MLKGITKEEKSWIFYDWANSAYTMTVQSTIMGLYFLQSAELAGIAAVRANAYWGFANTIVTIIVGLLAPILGTLSGYQGKKKWLFNFFVLLGVIATAGLAFIPEELWWLLLGGFMVSAIGFSGGNKIYDAFLVDVTTDEKMDWVSSLGFGLGYIGSTIPFIACIALVILAQFEVIPLTLISAYRISFLITALWWFVFTVPMFKNVHQKYGIEMESNYIRKSFKRIWSTFKDIKSHKPILIFLIAFFLYTDGVGSIIRMATTFGSTIGLDATTLLLVLLVTQFVAFPFAIIYGKMAGRFGAKNTIYFGIATYCVICLVALTMSPDRDLGFLTAMFWTLAMLVGTAQGGIQAISRSYFGRIIPKEKSNEYFGFYNIFGRIASILGTSIFGIISITTGQPHYGIAGIVILFVLAAIIFRFVPDDRKLLKV